jgi:tetratricopeptide (TPR) repeat protein
MAQMRIFVSHSSTDKRACDAFVGAMRGAGADVWYDEHNLGAGQLMDEIQRELHARPVFVVLLSPAALASKWVQRECKWAYALADADPGRIILPVVVGAIDPKELLAAMLFLSDFKRIEGPRNTPYPQAEAIERTLRLLELTPAGQRPAIAAPPQPSESLGDLLTKGRALTAQKKYAEAVPFFERATKVDPRSFDAWFNLGLSYNDTGRPSEGLVACDRALALNDKSAAAWSNKGKALLDLNRHAEAFAAYERALAIEPNATRWCGKGNALNGLSRQQEALTAFERAIALDPKHAFAWNGKGNSYWGLQRYADAVTAYDKAIALDPKSAVAYTAYKNKAISLRALGRTAEAAEADRKAKALGG